MQDEKEMEIDLLELFSAILQKWWIVLISLLVGGIVAFGGTKLFVTPLYQSDILIYVNNSSISLGSASVSISSGDISAAKTLVSTYGVILNSRLTIEEVNEKAGLDYTYEELSSMITSAAVNSTEVFQVTVTDPDAEEACLIANTIAEIFPGIISEIIDGSSARVVDLAVVSPTRSSPSYSKNAIVGMLVGAVLSVAVICAVYLLNDKLTSEDWLLQTWKEEIPLLSVIPDTTAKQKSGYRYYKYDSKKS